MTEPDPFHQSNSKQVNFQSILQGIRQSVEHAGNGPYFCWDYRVEVKQLNGFHGEMGIFATDFIPKGTIVWMSDINLLATDVLTETELLELPREQRDAYMKYTWMIDDLFFGPKRGIELEKAIQLDAVNFINHSCLPNVGFLGDQNMVALRDIHFGEQVTYDYCMSEASPAILQPFKCLCGESTCRSEIHGKTSFNHAEISGTDCMNPELQHRYAGHFLSSVQRIVDYCQTPMGSEKYHDLIPAIELKQHPNPIIGQGLFATEFVPKGALVWRLNYQKPESSVLVTISEVKSMNEKDHEFALHFGYQVGDETFSIPPVRDVNEIEPANFMNHSCNPTLTIYTDDLYIARRDIQAGEELTFDYALTECTFDRLPVCACGSPDCRGKVTKDDWKLVELRRRYGIRFSTHVLKKIMEEPWFFGSPIIA